MDTESEFGRFILVHSIVTLHQSVKHSLGVSDRDALAFIRGAVEEKLRKEQLVGEAEAIAADMEEETRKAL